MDNLYDLFRNKATEIKEYTYSSPILAGVFTEAFFKNVHIQIDEMEKTNTKAPLNSFFIFLFDDLENNFKQTKLLENYKDKRRYIGKLKYKSQQFIPKEPNVLALCIFGTRPPFISDPWSKPDPAIIVENVGLIMRFNRKTLVKTTTDNCDLDCSLTPFEMKLLAQIFSVPKYEPLVYGVA